MLRLDSHQHFWLFDPVRDSWITPEMAVLRADFLPGDLEALLKRNKVAACVAVQAEQSKAETEFLLGLAEMNNFIKGVVGWVDLCAADLRQRLEYYKMFPVLKGFRHIVQTEPPGFMLDARFSAGIGMLQEYGYTYDILVKAQQIKEACTLAALHPGQRFVLDHIGKPAIKRGEMNVWSRDIHELAAYPNVYCKISGLVTEADWLNWSSEDLNPYLDVVLEAFGTKRLMFGSDWPVCKLAAEYDAVCDIVSGYLKQLSMGEQEQIWSGNAIEFYNLDMGVRPDIF